MIANYKEFVDKLYEVGFSIGGENDEGIYSISSMYADNIKWHTGNIETDPWEWRIRVLEEKEDIAYSKVFFKKSGFITKKWYPYFLSIRRPCSFDESYRDGLITNDAKRIYDVVKSGDAIPLHLLKTECGVKKENKSKFDRALTELQMKMYITMCGRMQKTTIEGKPYGWYSTMFCLSEHYFGRDVFEKSNSIDYQIATKKITEQIYRLNPSANAKKIQKFITG